MGHGGGSWMLGVKAWLLIQLMVMAAALPGGSYYKLPKILQWFSGNISFHLRLGTSGPSRRSAMGACARFDGNEGIRGSP